MYTSSCNNGTDGKDYDKTQDHPNGHEKSHYRRQSTRKGKPRINQKKDKGDGLEKTNNKKTMAVGFSSSFTGNKRGRGRPQKR